ncbi:MAG TPA: tol-pal system protein YbgF [Thermoanaerobaculia bacterium]|nr:tol-pal system protein YbgF [Thermoanaerobaculia bacterium]
MNRVEASLGWRLAACVLALFAAAACSTVPADPPVTLPAEPAADPRVGQLQTAMTELLERIDVLNDRIAHLEEAQTARIVPAPQSAPEARATPRPSAQPQPVQPALASAKLADDYRKAIMAYGRGAYSEARHAFQNVFDVEPTGDLADNALFWIGETYFATRDYNNAMRYYARVVAEYADQNKAPDALYKTALAQEKTGDLALARKTLQQVIDRYPYSTSSSMAKQELQRIRY